MTELEETLSIRMLLFALAARLVCSWCTIDWRTYRFGAERRAQKHLSLQFVQALLQFRHGEALKLLGLGASADSEDEKGRHALCIAIETTENSTDLTLVRTLMNESTQLRPTRPPPIPISADQCLQAYQDVIIHVQVCRNLSFFLELPGLLIKPLAIITTWDESFWREHLQVPFSPPPKDISLHTILLLSSLAKISRLSCCSVELIRGGKEFLQKLSHAKYFGPLFSLVVLPFLQQYFLAIFFEDIFLLEAWVKVCSPFVTTFMNGYIGHAVLLLTAILLEVSVIRSKIQPRKLVFSSVLETILNTPNASAEDLMALLLEEAIPPSTNLSDPNSEFRRVWTWASIHGFFKVLQKLNNSIMSETNARQDLLYQALSDAVGRCDILVTRWLLEQGANVKYPHQLALSLPHTSRTPLALQWARSVACKDAKEKCLLVLNALVDNGLDVSSTSPESGETALSSICLSAGNVDSAAKLLAAGAHATLNVADFNGRTAIHHVARGADTKSSLARLLVRNGARVDILDNNGHTALWWAAHLDNHNIVTALLEAMQEAHVNVDLAREDTSSPLLDSCRHSSVAVVRQLIRAGANVNAELNGWTPLLAGLDGIHPHFHEDDLIQILLDSKAYPVLPLQARRQPLIKAAGVFAAQWKWVEKILTACDEPIPQQILDQAFQVSCLQGTLIQYDAVLAILNAGADATAIFNGGNALHHICHLEGGFLKPVVIDFLLRCSLDINAVNESNETALHCASISGDIDTVSLLLRNGARVDALDSAGRSPLHLSSMAEGSNWANDANISERLYTTEFQSERGRHRRRHIENNRILERLRVQKFAKVVGELLAAGSVPFLPDASGFTPLHYAVQADNDVTVKRILDHVIQLRPQTFNGTYRLPEILQDRGRTVAKRGPPVLGLILMRNRKGQTPIHIAMERGCVEVISALLDVDCSRDVGGTKLMARLVREYWSIGSSGRAHQDWLESFEKAMKELHRYSSDLENATQVVFRSSSTSFKAMSVPLAAVSEVFFRSDSSSPLSPYETALQANQNTAADRLSSLKYHFEKVKLRLHAAGEVQKA